MKSRGIIFLLHCLLAMVSFATAAKAKERFFVSFYPLEYAVESMVGDAVEVWNPVDSDPADWKPTKKQITKIQSSRLIFINGARFEKWAGIVSLPRSKLVETAKSFKKDWVTYQHGKPHRHGDETHVHKGFDGHTWMSPKRFLLQLQTVYEAVAKTELVDKNQLDERYQQLRRKFLELDQLWRKAGKKLAATGHVFTNHPAYNYLAKDYDFRVKNFDFNPGEDFGAGDKNRIVRVKEKGSLFWWESSPSQSQKQFIEKHLAVKNIVISPSEVRGQSDFYETMKNNVVQFQ